MKKIKIITTLVIVLSAIYSNLFSLVSPVRRNSSDSPLLINCDQIQLVNQSIDLYHHPLGIWIVECTSILKNLYPEKVRQDVGFNSGYDINMLDGKLYCDEFINFRAFVDGQEVKNIKFNERCTNYGDRIQMEWTNDDHTGTGFLNTWTINFRPEETKQVKVTFSIIVKRPSIRYNSMNSAKWYTEQMEWLKQEYQTRDENSFKLPLNMGSFWALYPDTVKVSAYYSDNWFIIEPYDKREYKDDYVKILTYSEPVEFYSPPYAELQSLTENDLKGQSKTKLKILRLSFFAKYGKPFNSKTMKLYFKNQPWYSESLDYQKWYLSDFDIENIKLIYEYEK